MQYLLELNEFDENNRLQLIYNRIESSGYVSKSAEKEIFAISGIKDFMDILYSRIDDATKFYSKYTKEFIDDILLEFFDGTPYTYTIEIGGEFGSDSRYGDRLKIIFNDEFEKDSEVYLLKKVISTIIASNKQEIEKNKKDLENYKKTDSWVRNPRGRGSTKRNYFKMFSHFSPMLNLNIEHKEYRSYYNDYPDYPRNLTGIAYDDFNNYRETSFLNRIKNRLSRISPCRVDTGYHNSFTERKWYNGQDEEGNEIIEENPNPILLRGTATIKF